MSNLLYPSFEEFSKRLHRLVKYFAKDITDKGSHLSQIIELRKILKESIHIYENNTLNDSNLLYLNLLIQQFEYISIP